MLTPRQEFRRALSDDAPVLAANIFDPLSARIAQLLGYSVCVLSGSVAKAASLAVPDLVLANMSDFVDHCRRILRAAPVSLMVDAEDGYGGAVNVMRTVAELEAAGVSAIEIEDNAVPRRFGVKAPGLLSSRSRSASSGQPWPPAPTPIRSLSPAQRPFGSARATRRWPGLQRTPRRERTRSCWRECPAGGTISRRCTEPRRFPSAS